MTDFKPGFGFTYEDMYATDGLVRIDGVFVDHLKATDVGVFNRLMAARAAPDGIEAKDHSELIIDLGPHLEDFIGECFGIETEVSALAANHHELAGLYQCKRLFVQRRAIKKVKRDVVNEIDGPTLEVKLTKMIGPFSELAFANAVNGWLEDEDANSDA